MSRCSLGKLFKEIRFPVSHVNGAPLHTLAWQAAQVQKNNKHGALLMLIVREPKGARIGRSQGQSSQSQGASIPGKLLLVYLASSEISFSRKVFLLRVSQETKHPLISIWGPQLLPTFHPPLTSTPEEAPCFPFREGEEKQQRKEAVDRLQREFKFIGFHLVGRRGGESTRAQ